LPYCLPFAFFCCYKPRGRSSPGLSFIGGRLPFVRKSSSVFFFGLGVGVAFLVAVGLGDGLPVDADFFIMPGIISSFFS
jgi:hypothetical protein